MTELSDELINEDPPTRDVGLFSQTASPDVKTKRIFRSKNSVQHTDTLYSAIAVEHQTTGSGVNGPEEADVSMLISALKTGYGSLTSETAPTKGEIDGLVIGVRQDGPDSNGVKSVSKPNYPAPNNSDCGGILINVESRGWHGFAAAMETITGNIDKATGKVRKQISTMLGLVNSHIAPGGTDSYGINLVSNIGVNDAAVLLQEAGAGTWQAWIRCRDAVGKTWLYIDKKIIQAPLLDVFFKIINISNVVVENVGGSAWITCKHTTAHTVALIIDKTQIWAPGCNAFLKAVTSTGLAIFNATNSAWIVCKDSAGVVRFTLDRSQISAPTINADFKSVTVSNSGGGIKPDAGWRIWHEGSTGKLRATNSEGVIVDLALP